MNNQNYIECPCGCKELFPQFSKHGYARKFKPGHAHQGRARERTARYILPKSKKCNACKIEKPIDMFRMKREFSETCGERYRPYFQCRDCEYETIYDDYKSPKNLTRKRIKRELKRDDIRYQVQERISQWKRKPGPQSDLTVDYLVDLYHKQEGKCYYTGAELIFGAKKDTVSKHQVMSLDKLNPILGYVQGNVAWCSYFVNTMKGNLNEEQFFDLMKIIIEVRTRKL